MKENNKEIKERLLKARALSDGELEQVTGGDTKGPFRLLCSNTACMAHTIPFFAATPGDTCPICNAGIIEQVYT